MAKLTSILEVLAKSEKPLTRSEIAEALPKEKAGFWSALQRGVDRKLIGRLEATEKEGVRYRILEAGRKALVEVEQN